MTDQPQASAFYTVVYRVMGGNERHNEWWRSIQPLFVAEDAPISITSITRGDLAAKMDELESNGDE